MKGIVMGTIRFIIVTEGTNEIGVMKASIIGVGLGPVDALSVGLVMALVPACAWFGRVKRRHADNAWLSYL